jgi:hypothetical protein
MDSLTTFLIVMIILIMISPSIINIQKGSINKTSFQEVISIPTKLTPVNSYKAIIRFLDTSKYIIDDLRIEENIVLLSEEKTLYSGGYYFIVSCKPDGNETKIDIGIKDKNSQLSKYVQVNHKRFVNLIRAALLLSE